MFDLDTNNPELKIMVCHRSFSDSFQHDRANSILVIVGEANDSVPTLNK